MSSPNFKYKVGDKIVHILHCSQSIHTVKNFNEKEYFFEEHGDISFSKDLAENWYRLFTPLEELL